MQRVVSTYRPIQIFEEKPVNRVLDCEEREGNDPSKEKEVCAYLNIVDDTDVTSKIA